MVSYSTHSTPPPRGPPPSLGTTRPGTTENMFTCKYIILIRGCWSNACVHLSSRQDVVELRFFFKVPAEQDSTGTEHLVEPTLGSSHWCCAIVKQLSGSELSHSDASQPCFWLTGCSLWRGFSTVPPTDSQPTKKKRNGHLLSFALLYPSRQLTTLVTFSFHRY